MQKAAMKTECRVRVFVANHWLLAFIVLGGWVGFAAEVGVRSEGPAQKSAPANVGGYGARDFQNGSNAASRQIRPTPQDVAAGHERAGRQREAAAIYEEIAHTNATSRKVLARRLVTIYAESGETNKALTWAREAIRDSPDPQAYLAAVHGRLGQWKEAGEILERGIGQNTNAMRAVTLRWQLAEVWEKAGDTTKARKLLQEAADAAKGTAMEPAAQKRLETLKSSILGGQ